MKSIDRKNAYRIFKEIYENNNMTHEKILKDLKKTSKYYGAFIGEKNNYSLRINEYLKGMYIIKQTTILPLLFKIFDDYEENKIDEDTVCNVLKYLLTYLIRINACEINKGQE